MTRPGGRPPGVLRRAVPRTLRARLIAGMLALLALTCAVVGVATTLALGHFLVTRVDGQLDDVGGRYPASLEHGPRPERSGRPHGGDTRGQAGGTFGARLTGGHVDRAAVVDGDGDDGRGGGIDDGVALTPADRRALAALPAGGEHRTVRLSALGSYRLAALPGDDGDVLVTGLPMQPVEETVHRLAAVEVVVFAGALVAAGVAGTVWVRLSLRPLRRVAATAARVSELPLASGEVALPDRVPDTDPGTEVGRVGAALNRMLGHVENALARRQAGEERLRRFAADASHELRTPVAAIRGHAELARRHPAAVPPEVSHALSRIQAESLRMGSLVEDLLLLARLDTGRPLAREEVDLTRLALDCAADARAAGPGHRWLLELPEEPVVVTGDRHRLQQVAANLLSNARTHTPPGSTVVLGVASLPGGAAELSVTDDGPGFPPELGDEVFGRFVRGDQARGRAGGSTGLGLAIVRGVVAAHGGTVAASSRPGHTVFRVTLPGPGRAPLGPGDAPGPTGAGTGRSGGAGGGWVARRYRTNG